MTTQRGSAMASILRWLRMMVRSAYSTAPGVENDLLVLDIALPSRHADISFHGRFRVRWRRVPTVFNTPTACDPVAAIHQHLYECGSKITAQHPISLRNEMRDLLRAGLICPRSVAAGIELVRIDTLIEVDELLLPRVAEYEARRLSEPLIEASLRHELTEIEHIRAILSDGGRARAWWLMKHGDDLATLRSEIFDEIADGVLCRRANGKQGRGPAELVGEAISRLEPARVVQLLESIEQSLRDVGQHDLAYSVKRHMSEFET
jgi:hypothetical protein